MIKTILSALVLLAVVWLAVTNANAVELHFFNTTLSISLALIIIVSLVVGFLFGILRTVPTLWKKSSHVSKQSQKITALETECAALKQELATLKNSTPLPSVGPEVGN